MGFSDLIKISVKKKANFTCCYCLDREKKVEIHHIIPQSEGGPDIEDNAAPLCSNCHTLYGGNPELRKEIKQRRNHWYETCQLKRSFWELRGDLSGPILNFYEEIHPDKKLTVGGTNILLQQECIQISYKDPSGGNEPSLLSLSFSYDNSKPDTLDGRILNITANFAYGLSLYTKVYVADDWSVTGTINILQDNLDMWILRGQSILGGNRHSIQHTNYLFLVRIDEGDNFLFLGIPTQTESYIQLRTRFSDEVGFALANYLEQTGFTKPFGKKSVKN